MAFTFEELEPPKGNIESGKWTATRVVWLKRASEFNDFVSDLVGVAFAAGSSVVQVAPQTFPGKPWLVLSNIEYEPMGDEAVGGSDSEGNPIDAKDSFGVSQPRNGYKFTLNYETFPFDTGGELPDLTKEKDTPDLPTDTFLTVRIGLGMEVLATDKSGLEWASVINGSKELGVNTSISTFVPTETIHMTWHRIKFPPWTNIRALRGKLNDDTFFGHESETVMFLGLEGQRQFQVDGAREWQLDYKFAVKEVKFDFGGNELVAGWNHFFRNHDDVSTPQWERVFTKASGGTETLYKSDNLANLFISEVP